MQHQKQKKQKPRKYPRDIDNARFIAWHRARAQAHYRGEQWQITITEWFKIWPPKLWRRRGRTPLSLCITRRDYTQPWHVQNYELVTRQQHLRRCTLNKPRGSWWATHYPEYREAEDEK